jgi:hypothetical protein
MNVLNSRRAFLKAVGAAGVTLPFYRMLESSALAAETPPPLRFVAFFTPHGWRSKYWKPKNGELDFDINFTDSMMKPLHRHRSKLLILDGLDYEVLYDINPLKSGHEGGPATFLTGSHPVGSQGSERPTSLSLDQAIANEIGSATKFRSLELLAYAQFNGQHVYNSISFGPTGNPIPWERSPKKVYERLFATGGDDQAAQRKLAKKRSLVSFLHSQTTNMRGRLAGTERQKLDAHLAALDDIEKRLNSIGSGVCTAPNMGSEYSLAIGDINNAPALVDLHLDLIAHAFACDLTRVATMPMGIGDTMPFIGLNTNIHDNIAHQIDSQATTPSAAQLETQLNLVKVQQWYAEKIASFMDKLAAIPEGNGSVLDNTLILWGNELGEPAGHSSLGIPTVLAGGAGGKFRMGRYLQLRPGKEPTDGWKGPGYPIDNAIPHNRLLVSIANAFNLETQTFGHPDYSGGLAGLI